MPWKWKYGTIQLFTGGETLVFCRVCFEGCSATKEKIYLYLNQSLWDFVVSWQSTEQFCVDEYVSVTALVSVLTGQLLQSGVVVEQIWNGFDSPFCTSFAFTVLCTTLMFYIDIQRCNVIILLGHVLEIPAGLLSWHGTHTATRNSIRSHYLKLNFYLF